MMRTQIQLAPEEHRRLKSYAEQRGISISEAARRGIALLLAETESQDDAAKIRAFLSVAGKSHDPERRQEVAAEHDRYLSEALRS